MVYEDDDEQPAVEVPAGLVLTSTHCAGRAGRFLCLEHEGARLDEAGALGRHGNCPVLWQCLECAVAAAASVPTVQ